MKSIVGNALVRTRPNEVAIDLRELSEPSTGRGRRSTMGASPASGLLIRSHGRLESAVDWVLAAWFGVPAISTGGELGATPAAGRVCGGNSPTKSSDLPSLGRGS